ncbi:MAG: hypothetical protein RL266_1128 [Bacteroidota bacterium]
MMNDHQLNVTAWHRQQWVGLEGAPVISLVNASYVVEKAKSGFGISLLSDKLGAQYNGEAVINYAFDGRIGEHHLIPGIQIGFTMNTLDGADLDPIQQNDPNLITEKSNAMAFDLGLGLAYRWRGLCLAFSTKHLTGQTLEFNQGPFVSTYTVARHYYFHTSYEAEIGQHLRLKPVTLVKSDAASTQFDVQLWVGARNLTKVFDGPSIAVGYRIDDAVSVAAEFKFKWFTLGYAYDITTSGLRDYSDGSHEGFLRIHFFQIPETPKPEGTD